jgi:hypothetical protein
VLPYVSLVAEKSQALEQFTTALGFRTEVQRTHTHTRTRTRTHAFIPSFI